MNYGLPYKGSKNKIAEWVVSHFPQRAHFYDLCAGGCAVTHCAMLQNKFETYTVNDVLDIPQLFVDAINGKYKNETRWISREDFFRLKDTDSYIKNCWSFGNNGKTYMYSCEIEPYKKACHFAIVFDQWEELKKLCPEIICVCQNALKDLTSIKQRRLAFGPAVVKELKRLNDWDLVQNNLLYKSCQRRKNGLKEKHVDLQSLESLKRLQSLESLESLERLQSLESLKRLQSLQSLERLERLQSLERLESLNIFKGSYKDVPIKQNSLIYCDIPYKNTDSYDNDFDYEEFYTWAENQTEPVIISEYSAPPDRFICIAQKEKTVNLSSTGTTKVIEKLFIPKTQKALFENKKKWVQGELF